MPSATLTTHEVLAQQNSGYENHSVSLEEVHQAHEVEERAIYPIELVDDDLNKRILDVGYQFSKSPAFSTQL